MTTTVVDDRIVPFPKPSALETPAVVRRGLGYRGVWADQGIVLDLERVHASHGDLTGLLIVHFGQRTPFVAKFNVATLTTRTSLAKHLKTISDGYDGWTGLLDQFCRYVLLLEGEGPEREVIGDMPAVDHLDYRLDPILPEGGPALLYGPPEVGKSLLAVAVACSVQTGTPVMANWVVRQGNVLVLDWETTKREWNDRLVKIARGVGLDPPRISYRRCRQPLGDMVETLAAQICEEAITLVIVDSMGKAHGVSHEGADPRDGTIRVFQALDQLGVTTLLIGQVSGDRLGNGSGNANSKPYGSVYQQYEGRSNWELRAEDSQARVHPEVREGVLLHRKFNQGPTLKPQGLRFIHGDTTILLERCEVTAPDLEPISGTFGDRLSRLLAKEGAMELESIAEALGVSTAYVRAVVSRDKRFVRLADRRVGRVQ